MLNKGEEWSDGVDLLLYNAWMSMLHSQIYARLQQSSLFCHAAFESPFVGLILLLYCLLQAGLFGLEAVLDSLEDVPCFSQG